MNLSADQQDMLSEAINIGVGRAASSLSEVVGGRVKLNVLSLRICGLAEMKNVINLREGAYIAVRQNFSGKVRGCALLLVPPASGQMLAGLLGAADDDGAPADFEISGILTEVGNIVLNSVMGSVANLTGTRFVFDVPVFSPHDRLAETVTSALQSPDREPDVAVVAIAHFDVIGRGIKGTVVLVFELGGIDALLEALSAINMGA